MQLNQDQIKYLFQFVDNKGVKYYDVQHEIVDHLASSIEDQMSNNDNLSFENALDNVYGKYPITGFAQYTVELEKSLRSFWLNKVFSMITSGYCVPMLAFIFIATLSMYLSITAYESVAANIWLYSTVGAAILALITFYKQFGKSGLEMMMNFEFISPDDDLTKRLLYYNVLKVIMIAVILVPVYTAYTLKNIVFNPTGVFDGISTSVLIFSLITAVSLFSSLTVIFYFPKMLKEVISSKYSHVVIA